MEDRLRKLYETYISSKLLSKETSFEMFSQADEETLKTLYDLGIAQKILSKDTDLKTFTAAWEVKKKDTTESSLEDGFSGLPEYNISSFNELQVDDDMRYTRVFEEPIPKQKERTLLDELSTEAQDATKLRQRPTIVENISEMEEPSDSGGRMVSAEEMSIMLNPIREGLLTQLKENKLLDLNYREQEESVRLYREGAFTDEELDEQIRLSNRNNTPLYDYQKEYFYNKSISEEPILDAMNLKDVGIVEQAERRFEGEKKAEKIIEIEEAEVSERIKKQEEAEKAERLSSLEDIDEDLSFLESDFLLQSEGQVVQELNEKLGKYGIVFSEGAGIAVMGAKGAIAGKNGVKMVSSTGETETVSFGDTDEQMAEAIEEIKSFVKGGGKKPRELTNIEKEASDYVKSKGFDFDYNQQIAIAEEHEKIDEDLEFIEQFIPYNLLSKEEKERFGKYYSGNNISVSEELESKMLKKKEILEKQFTQSNFFSDNNYSRARNEYDAYIDKKIESISASAVRTNDAVRETIDNLEQTSQEVFGVSLSELRNIKPKNQEEARIMMDVGLALEKVKQDYQNAATLYESANTYYDAKVEKKLQQGLADNLEAFTESFTSSLNTNRAGRYLLLKQLGLPMNTPLEEVAGYIEKAQNAKVGRALWNYQNAKTMAAKMQIFKNDPFEMIASLGVQVIGQMLPYWKEIVATTASGAVIGSSTGGPIGAVAGAIQGFRISQAAINAAIEYTNVALEAMRKYGYNPADTKSLEKAINDSRVWGEANDVGLKRAAIIMGVDYISGGVAGRVVKVGSVASRGRKIAAKVGEALIYQPFEEGLGEYLAQVGSGQDVNWTEIQLEAMGGPFVSTPMMVLNTYLDSKRETNIEIAKNLMDIDFISKEISSNSRISTWANNMAKLGKISAEQNQIIQENVGLRGEARNLLDVGIPTRFKPKKAKALESRVMKLLSAREQLSSTANRRSVFSKKISEINSELEDIATTKKLRDKDGETNLDIAGMPLNKGKRVGVYKIKGKEVSKQEFLDKVRTAPVEELDALNPEVRNDTESKSILDELLTGGLKSVKEQFQELDNTERQRFIDEADGDEASAINLFQKSIRENLFDNSNKISDNLFLREQGDTKRENQQRGRITTIATNAAKSISKMLPQVKIVMHNSAQDFNNVTNRRGAGFFSFDDNTIHVNLEDANLRTVPHEVFHAVLFNKLGEEGVASSISNMLSSVRKGLPKNSKIYKRVDEFAKMYEEDDAFIQDEERMSELFGIISSEYKKLSKPSKNAIIKFIQDIARKFGILDVITDTDEAVIDLMNTMSEKIRMGEELVEEDVKGFVVDETQEDIAVKPTKKGRLQKIDEKKVKSKYRAGKRISQGISSKSVKKEKVFEENESPLTLDYVRSNAPTAYVKNASILAKEDVVLGVQDFGEVNSVDEADKVYDIFTRQVANNLIFLHDMYPKRYRSPSTLWYDGANVIAQNMAKEFDVTEEQVAGIIAAMSPQKDWYQNVRLAEMTLISFKENPVFTTEMLNKQKEINDIGLDANKGVRSEYKKKRTKSNKAKLDKKLDKINLVMTRLESFVGMNLNDVPQDWQAYGVRLWNELNTSKDYDILRPDGESMGKAISIRTGENKRTAWQSYAAIGKAVSIYNDGSQDNITRQLGVKHKIRNFYNNIIDPNSPDGDVTIDTHAVAAALLKALSSSSKQVGNNFGAGGVGSSNTKGIQGTYYAYAEAYRMAAKELGLLPRQLQSITWEAVRGLYTDSFKANDKNVESIDNIWDNYAQGNIEINEARNEAIEKGGGINDPVWAKEIERESSLERTDESIERERSRSRKDIRDDVGGDNRGGDIRGRGQRSRVGDATENGQRIVTDSDITLFRGTKPKMRNGKPFSVHKIKKGKFAALDRKISLGYKGDNPLKIFEIPAGTTVEVVRLPIGQGAEAFRRNEENAIDASDAQVVKLVTYDASGKEDQYIVKDDDLLAAVRDETPQEEQEQNQRMAETKRGREQKGLINFTEKDAIKYSKIGIEDARTIQAMNNIGLSGVKFTKEGVENKIKESLNKLYNDYDSYLIDKDSNGITTQIQNEIDGAEDLPPNIVQQLKDGINNESFRKKYIDKYRETQDETARQWVSYLKESEYSDAFKYLILDAVLTNNYDLNTLKYKKRTNTTIRNITPFDAGTLATLYVSDSKNLLKSYIEVQQENLKNIIKASQVDKMGKGRWLKFDGGPNAQNLSENANSLSQLVQDTYWCTKSNALSQLRDGDFYVYVTGDSPRIAIRMEGDKVGEVRGNASSKQDIEPDMLPIADKFLREKIPNDSGKKWLDSIEFNKKAKAYLDKIKSDGIGDKEIIEYANILAEGSKYNTDYGENGFITRIKSEFKNPNIKPEIREYVAMGVGDFNPAKTKHILGDVVFKDSEITDLGNLQSIVGSAYFEGSEITDLGNLQSIGANANFNDSNVTDLGNLQSIGGNADFKDSEITDLGNLQSVGGSAYFRDSKITDLGNLQSIGGDASFKGSNVTDLGNLQSVGGGAYFRDSNVTDLGNLQSIGRSANFKDSNVTDLGNLQSIGSSADFEDSKITDLGNLQSIGGSAYFEGSEITDLGNLQSIGRSADFKDSEITDLGNLQSIGGNAYFRDSNVTDLGNLQSIGGSVIFVYSNVTDLGNLQSIGGNADFAGSKITDLGNLQSVGGSAYFGLLAGLKSEWVRRQSETPRGKEQRTDKGAKKRIKTITGQIKNYKSITLNEKQLLVKRFRDLNEGAKNLKAAQKLATKLLLDELSDLRTKGTISTRQLEFILRRFSRVNLLNEDSISKFVDYMANVFENVEYAEKISKANKKKKTAFKNAGTTNGIPSGLSIKLKEVFAVNPTMIPKSVLDGYMKLIDMFGGKARVLSIPEQTTVNKIVDSVLNKIREEESTIPELKARFDGAEKVIDKKTGKIDYAATLKDMLKEQKIIDEDDLELMKKYKSLIFPIEKAAPKTDEEIQAEVDKLVDDISKQKISDKAIKDLPDRERRDAARKLKSLLKGELLSQLGVSDLKNISKLINLINNGYYPHFADVVITELSGLQVDGAVKVIQKAKPLPLEKIFRAFSISRLLGDKKRSSIYSMIVNNPSALIDNVIGNFKTQELFETLFKPIRQAIEGYKRDYKDINYRLDEMKKRVQKSLGRGRLLGSRNAFVMSKYKQMIYLIQKEFENNPNNPKVHQASEFIKKTIATIKDGKSNFGKYDADMLQEILDTYSDNDGNIDSNKLYDSFNKVEKESIELIREINNSLVDMAEYTSTIIRGQEFESYNDYIHRIVIDVNGSTDFNIEEYSNGMMVSTRGKSLISRTKAVSALDFDVYRSVERGSKSVLMDYYLTPAVRIGRSRLKNIKKKLMGDNGEILNDLQREVYNAIDIAFGEELESLLENTYGSAGFSEQVNSLIKKNGYRAMLAGIRVVREFLSNISAALNLDSKALMEGLKNQKLIFSEVAPMAMKNLKSVMLERVYPSSGLSGRFIDEDVSLKTLATRGNAKSKIKNVLLSSWDNTLGRWTRSVGEIQDSIISKPDSIINQPFWFGSFIRSFKDATGKEPDFDKIAMNDEAYMNEYKAQLGAATKFADNQTKSIGAAKGEFIGIAANRIKKGDTNYLKAYKTFNGFMTNFIINDYVYVRKAIYNLVSRGEMSKRKAAALLSGIITRNMVYFIMGHYSNVVLGELAQYISGEDDEEETLTFTQVLGKAIAQTFNTYLFGRNAGNITRSLINIPVEYLNKEFGQPLRTGEYDPYKDAIGFVIKSGKAPYEKAGVQDYLVKMTGAYQPIINTSNLIYKQIQDKDKTEEDAIQRQKDTRQIRIPLEVLGNLGFIPLYKDIRKVTNDVIYSSMKKSKDEESSSGTSRAKTSRSNEKSSSGTSRTKTSRSD